MYLLLSTGEINVKSLSSLKICLDIANTCFPFESIFLTMNRCALRERRFMWYCQISITLFSKNLLVTYILVFLELHIPYCFFKVNISHCNIFPILFLTLPSCDDVIIGGDCLIKFHKWREGHRVHIKKTVQSTLNLINIARLQRRIQKLVKHLRWGLLKKFCKRLQRRYLAGFWIRFWNHLLLTSIRAWKTTKSKNHAFL